MGYKRGPDIVLDKLVFAIDAITTRTYPGTGAVVYDLSGNGYNGTLVNGMGLVIDSTTGPCFQGDGTNDNITFPESNISKDPSFYLGDSFGNFTYECWVKREGTSASSGPRIMSTDASDYSALYMNGAGAGNLLWRTNVNGASQTLTYSAGLNTTDWYHIVGTHSLLSTVLTRNLYINGVSVLSGTGTSSATSYGDGTSRAFGIFSNVEGTVQNNNCFNGKITISRIYGKALSAEEVLKNYTAHKKRHGH